MKWSLLAYLIISKQRSVGCLFLILMLFLPALGVPVSRQAQKTDDEPAIELRSDLVSFTLTVSLPDGQILSALKPESFRVFENNARQEIAHFSAVDAPVDMMLMVDTSGSMREQLSLIRQAAEEFVQRMRSQDRVGVIAFGEQVELLADLTSRPSTLKEAIGRFPTSDGTVFYDALYLVATDPLKEAATRKAMIVLSDGVDSSSYYTYEQASEALERTGVVSYFIEVDTEKDMIRRLKEKNPSLRVTLSAGQLEKYRRAFRHEESPLRYRYPHLFTTDEKVEIAHSLYQLAHTELRQMADRTGGKVFPLKTFSQLSKIYEQISAELSTLYSIGYYPTNSKRDGTWRSLRVEVNIPGAKAHARSGYWAPSK